MRKQLDGFETSERRWNTRIQPGKARFLATVVKKIVKERIAQNLEITDARARKKRAAAKLAAPTRNKQAQSKVEAIG